MSDNRRLIDDALRDVPVPPGLADTVHPEALFADDQLDRLLVAVTVPTGLADRVRAGLGAQPTRRRNGTLDLARLAAGADAPAESATVRRRERQGGGLLGLAREAASVAAALGLAGLIAVAGIEFSRRLEGPGRPGRPADVVQADAKQADGPPARRSGAAVEATPALGGDRALRLNSASRFDAGSVRDPTEEPSAPVVASRASPETEVIIPEPRVSPQRSGNGIPRVLGSPIWPNEGPNLASPPGMVTVDIPGEVRRHVPRVRGYDLSFEMRTGEQPLVDPAADPSLAVDFPPLTLRTVGFESLVSGDPRSRVQLRAEEVLAAVPARVAAAAGGPAIRLDTSLVRLPDANGTARPSFLLEVAASAAAIRGTAADNAAPLAITLVLDQAAAGDPATWPRICRGLAAIAPQMAPADRVTVVLCGPRPRIAAYSVDAAGLATVAADLEWLPPTASSDLDAGLDLVPAGDRVVVVAHASSLDGCRGRAREGLAAWHAALSAVGGDPLACSPPGNARFIVLDPATPSPSLRGEPTFGRTSPDAISIRRGILQQLTGRDTLVARHCELEVRFDPRQVARYRLIGHRQSAIESLAGSRTGGIDLHAGETVRVVYEVVPRNGSEEFAPARATFRWRAGATGPEKIEATARLTASESAQGLPSPHGCEILLAAGLGELAAGSGHIDRRQAAAAAAALKHLAAEWRRRGDVTPFGEALMHGLDRSPAGRRTAL